jgi:hypothetical protein
MTSGRGAENSTLPYVAKCGFGWQLSAVLLWPIILWALVAAHGSDGRLAMVQLWEEGGIVKKLGIVFLWALIPSVPLEAFRARTVFTEDEIRHLPTFGRWRTFRYQDIVALEVFPNEFARLEFRDGRTLKIWAMRADPLTVEGIIRRKWRPQQVIRSNHAESAGSREST